MLPFLRLRNASIEFPIYSGGSRPLKKLLFNTTTQGNIARDARDRITVQALKQINLDIEQGDRLALVGGNGAGKSTLLKILAGIYAPSHGQVHINGRISALLTMSVGFNPDATGRENIINLAMHMDVHPREMRTNIDEIVEFSGLGYYIDMPVRTYSTGMMIRLSFAVAISVLPEILLMDEWFAAGDAAFLKKTHKRVESFVSSSSIMVLASHSMPLLRKWCNRAILLDGGRIVAAGTVAEIEAEYRSTRPSLAL